MEDQIKNLENDDIVQDERFVPDGGATLPLDDLQEEDIALVGAILSLQKPSKLKKRITKKKVDEMWKKKRGSSSGPNEAMIKKAIKISDTNGDGVLQPDEMKRLAKAFCKKSSEKLSTQEVFTLLDENSDGVLGVDEVTTAFKAMWLMTTDKVKLSELIEVAGVKQSGDLKDLLSKQRTFTKLLEDQMTSPDGGAALSKLDEIQGEDIALVGAIISMQQPSKSKKMITKRKVDEMWKEKRGNAGGPNEATIRKAIRLSDTNGDGVLQPDEMKRLAKAFCKKSSEKLSKDEVFALLDENSDGVLGFDEVTTAFKAMWLMTTDKVKLDDLIEEKVVTGI